MSDGNFLDTEGITQGRKPRELHAVEFKYINTEGKKVTATLTFQRKSDRDKAVAAWDKYRSARYEDTSTVATYKGTISWEAA